MPYQIVYTSSESKRMRPSDLRSLLQNNYEKYSEQDITGILLYRNGSFIEVLEGDQKVVQSLYSKLKQHERHQGVTTLSAGPIDKREFSNWRMSFDLPEAGENETDLHNMEGFSDFLDPDKTEGQFERVAKSPSFAYEALLRFKGNSGTHVSSKSDL